MRIGINGFGRIGRNIFRAVQDDERIDQIVRREIDSQSRTVQQGTETWDILYPATTTRK